jgi:tetratricopeptide (TPR) repeat protein
MIFEKFNISGTPTELFVDKDGKEVDWIVGYGPPPDKFLERVQKSVAGIDTYLAVSERYAKEPTNVEVIFKLAEKCGSRYSTELTAKSQELYKKVIALDPEGKSGNYTYDYLKATVSYTQAAEFALGQTASFGRKPDPAPLQVFIKKYPASPLAKQAYSYLGYYYGNMAAKEDAAKFFEEYTAKYPDDKDALSSYVERIIRDKEPLDKGISLAEKLKDIAGYPENPNTQQNLAQLYALKGDPAKAEEEYGKDFIDGYVSNAVYNLTGYANFWIEQGKNLESAEEMADLVVRAYGDGKDGQWYTLAQVAGIYAKLNKTDKALAIYGPEFAKKYWVDQAALSSYANFWNRQGTNLDNALAAAKKSVELTSDYYNNYILGQVLFKLKNYAEALKAAEKAVEMVKPMAVKYEGFPTQQYEKLVKDIKDAMAKEKGAEVKK